jgi:hypothetical protein
LRAKAACAAFIAPPSWPVALMDVGTGAVVGGGATAIVAGGGGSVVAGTTAASVEAGTVTSVTFADCRLR